MQSSDSGHFFQTDSALSESKRKTQKAKNEAGQPIRLQSKLLAVIADPFDQNAVYVAEAAGTLKRIALETASTTHTLRASTATPSPFTCLSVAQSSATSGTLFAGSWDKNVYAWPIDGSVKPAPTSTATLKGHTDFVKALICIPPSVRGKASDPLLVSASSDKSIMVWNARTFERLYTLTGHARGVQALTLDPLSIVNPLADPLLEHTGVVVASGDSNREIRFWQISSSHAQETSAREVAGIEVDELDGSGKIEPLVVHETSLFDLAFSSDGDLWTASADGTAKQLARMRGFAVDETLVHTDYVKAVVVVEQHAGSAGQTGPVVVTGCRDEDVRVWDMSSGKCLACLRGHYEEVTGLAMVREGHAVVSVSIDGTIRTWGLAQQEMQQAMHTFEAGADRSDKKPGLSLTEDEEREIAELLDEDD